MKNKQLIPIYDAKNNYIKSVFSRYAVLRVLQKKAVWINSNTALQLMTSPSTIVAPKPKHTITQVFLNKGDSFTIQDAMIKLMSCFPNDIFARQKAAGALGGASRKGFIVLSNGIWTRAR